jgi:hypothetical protein
VEELEPVWVCCGWHMPPTAHSNLHNNWQEPRLSTANGGGAQLEIHIFKVNWINLVPRKIIK